MKLHESSFEDVAQVTFVWPSGKNEPDGKPSTKFNLKMGFSAMGVLYCTITPVRFFNSVTSWLLGQSTDLIGEFNTLIENVQVN
jgi:hypothetical protein